ncbi:50S ribosomal protein L6 [Candidatus Methylomirabilis lanthanidiphila]|uniref:Large ribosomal subunit protein uL6 n=1 Tax=Candidatus Methylomirabilis lanthanidiphila TaxID=2211376 RepID=A0A564ZH12_9BACT|nr:50S ribosomal protein L6 [Candidatus Methylomirabilis lanthanidiphila]VUZ84416.1 50S ribosomal protein L6 [Candidatus Methylomirabilis lanthanidiphila]
MSRIGRKPIQLSDQVKVEIAGSSISVQGPKGKLSLRLHPSLAVKVEDNRLHCTRPTDNKLHRSLHGLSRTLIANMVEGVTKGFEKKLEMVGVGYRASVQGRNLSLMLGYSHPLIVPLPDGINVSVESQNLLTVSGSDKQQVGTVAAKIRSLRPPEPYKGKGVKYAGERIRRKAGKAGA